MKKYDGATSGKSCWIAALMFPLIWPILDNTDKPIPDGDTAVKYGEDIGKVIADIPKGEHVHTHNCKTKRW